jgi:hypothetical protein
VSDPRLLFGRSHDEAVQDVLDDLAEDGPDWQTADSHDVAGYLDWMVSVGGSRHVAEAIWRHFEFISNEDGAA